MTLPRRFQLDRDHDVSGVSGTGVVADGVEFEDGAVVVRWRGERPSTVVWPDVASVEAIHGHGGATRVRWVDLPPGRGVQPRWSWPEGEDWSREYFAKSYAKPGHYAKGGRLEQPVVLGRGDPEAHIQPRTGPGWAQDYLRRVYDLDADGVPNPEPGWFERARANLTTWIEDWHATRTTRHNQKHPK